METLSTARYDEIADWYAEWVTSTSWAHEVIANHLPQLCGDVAGKHILDIACGEGVFSRLLASGGAYVHGVDISSELLQIASSRANGLGPRLSFSLGDAHFLTAQRNGEFDGAVCLMALMDIPELPAVYAAARRVVHDNGWLVIAVTHPCFDSPHAGWEHEDIAHARTIEHYLDEGMWRSRYPGGIRAKVGAHHRTLSTYVNEALHAGWSLDRLLEPAGGLIGQNPLIPRLLMARFHAIPV